MPLDLIIAALALLALLAATALGVGAVAWWSWSAVTRGADRDDDDHHWPFPWVG